jgi:hypothetical protein
MAFANVNSAFGVPVLTRGKAVNLGTIAATANYVTFVVTTPPGPVNGFDSINFVTTGNLVATVPILECSLDGGATFFGITLPTSGSTVPILGVTVLTGETASSTANAYSIAGLQGLVMRYGFNTVTSGSGACWAFLA